MGDSLNRNIWKKIQYWRNKYNSTPNGWAVALMIGDEYISEASKNHKMRKSKVRG
jgi:hypothetical protein